MLIKLIVIIAITLALGVPACAVKLGVSPDGRHFTLDGKPVVVTMSRKGACDLRLDHITLEIGR